jgi:hypothetical protein
MTVSLQRLVARGEGRAAFSEGPLEGVRWASGMPTESDEVALAGAQSGAPTWAVIVGGECVGLCGLHFNLASSAVPEIGYGIAASARKAGFATVAVKLLLDELGRLGVRNVVASVEIGPGEDLESSPSCRVLRANGFVLEEAALPEPASFVTFHRPLFPTPDATMPPRVWAREGIVGTPDSGEVI